MPFYCKIQVTHFFNFYIVFVFNCKYSTNNGKQVEKVATILFFSVLLIKNVNQIVNALFQFVVCKKEKEVWSMSTKSQRFSQTNLETMAHYSIASAS